MKATIEYADLSKITSPNDIKALVLEGDNSRTKTMGDKIVLRPSMVDMHCPYEWALKVYGLVRSTPKAANSIGTAYHAAAEAFDTYRILSNGDMPPPDWLWDIAQERIAKSEAQYKRLTGGDMWENAEGSYSKYDSKERLFTDLQDSVYDMHLNLGSLPTPATVECRLTQPIDHPKFAAVSGSVDRLTRTPEGYYIVDDHKFTKTFNASKLDTYAVQQSLYLDMAHNAGLQVVGGRLLGIDRGATRAKASARFKVLTVNYNRNRAYNKVSYALNLVKLIEQFRAEMPLIDAITMLAPTTNQGDFLCSKKWCEAWDNCPLQNGKIKYL